MEQYRRKPILPGVTLLSGFPEECCIYAVEGEGVPTAILYQGESLFDRK